MSPESRKDVISSKHIAEFAAVTRRLLHSSNMFLKDGAVVEVLVNPASGLLKQGLSHNRMMRHLNRLADVRGTSKGPRNGLEVRFHETESRRHTGTKAVELVQSLVESAKPGRRVLTLAGGDGFHNDVCNALLRDVPDVMEEVLLFRLPMGTGNDNADAVTVEEAFAILGSASGVRKDAVIKVESARGVVKYAFNVASFGLDAYIVRMTNRMKSLAGPRLIYKIFADIGVLFYEVISPLKPWDITIEGPEGTAHRRGRFLLTVLGRKGDTRYGGGMKVLPGPENFVLIKPLSLMNKFRIKPLFFRGAHRGLPISEFFHADRLTLTHEGSILMQLDGEDSRLERADFPLVMSKIPDVLTILT